MYTKLKFKLRFSFCNGAMQVQVKDNQRTLIDFMDVAESECTTETDILLPSKLTFNIQGKNMLIDTQLDSNNNIIADKYVILESMSLGGIPIRPDKLFESCYFEHDGVVAKDTFWGFNGVVTIDFDEENFIKWHLKNNNIFDFEWAAADLYDLY